MSLENLCVLAKLDLFLVVKVYDILYTKCYGLLHFALRVGEIVLVRFPLRNVKNKDHVSSTLSLKQSIKQRKQDIFISCFENV